MPAGGSPHPVLTELGERIRTRRIELGLSQELLAELSGLHRTYLPGIEKGQRNVTVVVLLTIADALRVPAAHLLEGLDVAPATVTRGAPRPPRGAARGR